MLRRKESEEVEKNITNSMLIKKNQKKHIIMERTGRKYPQMQKKKKMEKKREGEGKEITVSDEIRTVASCTSKTPANSSCPSIDSITIVYAFVQTHTHI